MNFPGVLQREKRHPSQMYHPMYQPVSNYWTEAFQKTEMKHDFSDEFFLNNIHLIPDPLKKNLADSLFNTEMPKKPVKDHQQGQKMTLNDQKVPLENMSEKPTKQASFGGIGNFFSGVINVLTSVVFRTRSPVNYYDCDVDSQGSVSWHSARTDVQDKNGSADDEKSYPSNPDESSDMNPDSRAAVTSCESKLNQVLHLLTPKATSSPVWVRKRPKKVFVEPGSVSESFEDAFCPEDFENLPNYLPQEYVSLSQCHNEDLSETAAQITKFNTAPIEENMLVKDISSKCDVEFKNEVQLEQEDVQLKNNNVQLEQQELQLEKSKPTSEKKQVIQTKLSPLETETADLEVPNLKENLVLTCEDKLAKLKALLKERNLKSRAKHDMPDTSCATSPKTAPTDRKLADRHFKNPNRRCSKRTKSNLKCRIEDDLVFANEISIGTPPSAENSPSQHNVNFGDYFDEVSGRFRTESMGSDDSSFQIVFNDCPSTGRIRKSSDCDSEDSFIVFEDSPESCYVSNDVFDSDSESEVSDSGCGVTCKLAHTLTRTVSNLADDSLYVESEDEVDFGHAESCEEDKASPKLEDTVLKLEDTGLQLEKSGLLLDDKKKQLRKSLPPKKVHFSTDPPKVRVMRVWAFAAKQARAGHWERYAVDRERFKKRIADLDMALSWVLKPQHRSRVMFQRFMPWWNKLKRMELAEKKDREEEEKRKQEEQREEAERQRMETEKNNEDDKSPEDDTEKQNVKTQKEDEVRNFSSQKKTEIETINNEHKDLNEENKIQTENKSNVTIKEIDSNTEKSIKYICTKEDNIKKSEFNADDDKHTIINDDVKLTSNLIIQNEDAQLAKKIQDLEMNDKNNIEIIGS